MDSSENEYEGLFDNYDINEFNIDDIVEEKHFLETPLAQTILMIALITVFVFGIIGNSLVIFTRNQKWKTPLSFFLIALALADILLLVAFTLLDFIYAVYESWTLGSTMCHLLTLLMGFGEAFTSIAVAVIFAMFLLFPKIHLIVACITTVSIGTLALIVAAPEGYKMKMFELEISEQMYCVEDWSSDDKNLILGIFFIKTCLPVATIIISVISHRVLKGKFKGESDAQLMLTVMVVIHFLMTTPKILIKQSTPFIKSHEMDIGLYLFVFLITSLLSYFSLVFKPILYALTIPDFRNGLRTLFKFEEREMETYALHENDEV